MTNYPILPDEEGRIEALQSYNILDTLTEKEFDDLTELASVICGVPIALISLVDADRQWFKSHKGLPISQTERAQSFCAHAIAKPEEVMVVENAHEDDRFKDNPLVTGDLNLTFYAGVPLVNEDGYALGSLCVIDKEKKTLSDAQMKALQVIARQVTDKLELQRNRARLGEVRDSNTQLQGQLEETREELSESEASLRMAVEAANLGLWIYDLRTNKLITSKNYKKLLGFPEEDEVTLEDVFAIMEPASIIDLKKVMQDGKEQKKNPVVQYAVRHTGNGQRRWIRGVGKVETDAEGNAVRLVGMNMDITEQVTKDEKMLSLNEELQASNEQLKTAVVDLQVTNQQLLNAREELVVLNRNVSDSEEKLRLAIEASRLGTWYINTSTREFVPSMRLKELFGYYPEETMPYEAAVNQIREDYRQRVMDAVEASIGTSGTYDIEYPITGYHDGALRWVRATGRIYRGQEGGAPVFFGTMEDITERKQNELRRNDFISMVSHELKAPLAVVLNSMQLIRMTDTKVDPLVEKMADIAIQQVRKMTGIINGFLNKESAESGKIQLVKQVFNMGEVVSALVREFSGANPSLAFDYEGCNELEVTADKDKITNVISNFLTNAVKYAPESRQIDVACAKTGDAEVRISVTDKGKGIAAAEQPKIFERHYRATNAQNMRVEGQGIGLYLSAEIVQAHGGEIGVESEEGKGSTFWFTLPGK